MTLASSSAIAAASRGKRRMQSFMDSGRRGSNDTKSHHCRPVQAISQSICFWYPPSIGAPISVSICFLLSGHLN
jgi:hypothetical protein